MINQVHTAAAYEKSASYIRGRVRLDPDTAIVLGSGLGALAGELEDAVRIPYAEIPGFPRSTVQSHAGELLCGTLAGRPVYVMSGRFHYYEGYEPETVCFYIRVLKLLGVDKLILTNAAGGVNEGFRPGDFMLIRDQIKLFGVSPARGPHLQEFGSRFFDMTTAYSPRLNAVAHVAADAAKLELREGVYFYMPGPEFETPAEIRAIRMLGGDAVGMSTVMESVAAAQCGMETLGISCISNMAAGMISGTVISDEEVNATAKRVSTDFCALIKEIVLRLAPA